MNILETFVILFTGDASSAEKAAEKATGVTAKFEERLKSADSSTQVLGRNFLALAGAAGAALGAIFSIQNIAQVATAYGDFALNLQRSAERLGISAGALNAWGNAVELAGGDAKQFTSSISELQNKLAYTAVTGEGDAKKVFAALNIGLTDARGKVRNVLDVLPDLATQFERLGNAKSAALGQKLGLDEGTIMLLQRGRREVEVQISRQQDLNGLLTAAADANRKYEEQNHKTQQSQRTLGLIISTFVLPVLTVLGRLQESVFSFVTDHMPLVIAAFGGLAAIVSVVALPAFVALAAGVWAALAPLLPFIAALGLLAIVADDIWGFVHGQKSLTGEILNFIKTKPELMGYFSSIKYVVDAVKYSLEGMIWLLEKVSKVPAVLWKLGQSAVVGGQAVGGYLRNDVLGIKDGPEAVPAWQRRLQDFKAQQSTNSSSVNIGELNVHTQATDADGMARAARGTLTQQLRHTQGNYSDGVAG